MSDFKVHILGCGSALPTLVHNTSTQIVEIRGKFFMIDCGEGTQKELRKTHVNFNKIQAVFISHLHGDHCLGLVGMISSFGLLGRTAPLNIYGPGELAEYLPRLMDFFSPNLEFELVCHSVDTTKQQIVYEDRSLTVESVPLNHRMPCCGYLFREKQGQRHIRREMIDFYHIPLSQINNIKAGMDWTDEEGNVISNGQLTLPATPSRSYAFCSDTRYMPELAEVVKGVDLLYHEATYPDEKQQNAVKYKHSTAREAAQTAKSAGVGKLIIGHYCNAMQGHEEILLNQAREVFSETYLTDEGKIFEVKKE